jgi:hypothetical protein
MAVNVRKVRGRRKLRFETLDGVIADAEMVVASPNVRMLGNLSLSQILAHLSLAIDGSIDGIPAVFPWPLRILGRTVGRLVLNRTIRRGIPPGHNLKKGTAKLAFPDHLSNQESLERLRRAVGRAKKEQMIAPHPLFGPLKHEQWHQLHLRHSEMHMSFASLDPPKRVGV